MRHTRSPAILDKRFLSQLLLPNRQVNETVGETHWQTEPDPGDPGITVILSTVRNGRWRHYWCVPAADGRSDLTRQSSPSFPSQHNRCNATGCFFFATIVPVKPSAGVAISLLHITAVQYYSYSLFLFFFCIETASGLSEFRSQLSRLYCEKCWGLPSLKKWQTVRVDDHIFTNLSSDSANLFPW